MINKRNLGAVAYKHHRSGVGNTALMERLLECDAS